ncbi:hypothetical protein A2316_03680 [Candidatus Falkowbacteria bacterium RIFOXYB2_FULL_38_15]|uniref:DUF916 domain-containing protein n=1 Tax=Candidatus Falkowbacteria bacterium RIFOXYA2_FULL_38_12 TaxID=1797993 RepID=A0A1F5S3Y3_9BACT|nr:MAG: hypothetical protein A2257_00345 [Candidatus Falkowbacteria bacterium RIFOXYA2_FULL_38_12]OGF32194.1 MAG: hypothetical protein A2316_03680 [Candidatus Falkowbacteria bacterium RIFOXYB2_FULL_38_15]OGF44597.1 MAG: hypothetical protein A2555_00980 [Candidatus Falkowbacteria bacterium RIFOXYD2_FULL_39_16]
MKKTIIKILLLIALAGFFPISSFALTISPPTMEFIAKRGETITDVVKLFNETSAPITLVAEVRDFKPLNEKGTPNFLPIADKNDPSKLSNWIDVKEKTVTLKSNERKNILFTINIPDGAFPGGHFAGILWAMPSANKDSVGITSKTGTLILVNIAGMAEEKARIIEFSADKKMYNHLPVNLSLRFENMGNVYLKPIGEIKIKNIWGKEVASLDVNPGLNNALPGSVRQYNVSWKNKDVAENLSEIIKEKDNFAFGRYSAVATLGYGSADQTLIAEKSFWVFPWRVIGISLITILVVFLIFVLGIKRYNRWILEKYGKKS